MNRSVVMISAILIILISLISIPLQAKTRIITATGVTEQTATKNAQARVNASIPKIPRLKIFRSNPLRKNLIFSGSDPYQTVEDDNIITGYRKRDFQKIQTDPSPNNPDGISEEVLWKLFLARQVALIKYREKFG